MGEAIVLHKFHCPVSRCLIFTVDKIFFLRIQFQQLVFKIRIKKIDVYGIIYMALFKIGWEAYIQDDGAGLLDLSSKSIFFKDTLAIVHSRWFRGSFLLFTAGGRVTGYHPGHQQNKAENGGETFFQSHMAKIYYLSSAEIIIFLTKMDFNRSDIHYFLLQSIPSRFMQLSSPEFGEFIQYLFQKDGFEVRQPALTGEFSNVIVADKGDTTHVILPFRKDPDEFVEENDIRKVLRAGILYHTNQSWIITNTSFTPEAKKLAEDSGIELWDWDALYDALCQMFFNNKSHEEYLEHNPLIPVAKEADTGLKLKVKWQAAEGITPEWFNLGITIMNPTDQNLYVHLEMPALIDSRKNQVIADRWSDGEFDAGMIYAGASVRTNALFSVARLGDRPPGGKIVLTCHERREIPITYHLHARLKGEACYIVTYCYSRQSQEYREMIMYRDEVLSKSLSGRALIRLYYFISPCFVKWAARHGMVDALIRKIASRVIPFLQKKLLIK